MEQPITVFRCFHQAGALTASIDVCFCAEDEETDPFEDLDREGKIQQLIEYTMNIVECCTSSEYVSGNDCLAVCQDLDDDTWEEKFIADLADAEDTKDDEVDGGNEDESDQEDQLIVPQIKSLKDAIASLEQVQHFLEFPERIPKGSSLSRTVDNLAKISANSAL